MKRTVAITMLGLLLAVAWPGWAQQGQGPQQGRRGAEQQRPMPAPSDRGWQGRKGDGDAPRREQLSPEERQQLRRDISDHGRDIYRDPRGKPRRQ